MIKVGVVVLVIGLWSCQLCNGEPSGHVNAKTTAPEQQPPPPPPPLPTSEGATAGTSPTATTTTVAEEGEELLAPTAEAAPRSDAESLPENGRHVPNKYSYSIGNSDRAYGQLSMYPVVAAAGPATPFEDTTPGHRLYVTLPENQPLHVPYASQHRFGPFLRNPQKQDAKKFDENIILLEDNKGPSDSPYDTILKPLFISPDLIQIPLEDPKNEQIIHPSNSPDNPSGSLLDLQKLFEFTKSVVNDNDVLVINDAATSSQSVMRDAEANVRNFTNFEGGNEIDQMAVESAAARNMTMMMDMTAEPSRIERSGVVDAETANASETNRKSDAMEEEEEDDEKDDEGADEKEGAESKIRYSRFRKITPIVVKPDEEDCDDENDGQPEAQRLVKLPPTRDYLPSKVNVEIVEDHNNGQFLKETVFIAAPPKTDDEAPSRQFLRTFHGNNPTTATVTTKYQTIVNTTPIPLGLRTPKTDEDCDDPPHFKGKTIVEVQKSVSVTERRVSPQALRGGSRFVNQPSKCLTDCSTPQPFTLIPSPRPQQVIVEKPVIIDRFVEKPFPVTVEKIVNRPYPVDRIVEKPVTIVKSVQVPVPVDRVVEKPVHVTKFVDRPYPVDRVVEKPVPYPVERVVEKLVPQPYPVEKQVQVTVEKIVDRPVDRIVEKFIDRPYPVEKIVEKQVEVQVPVTQIVEKIVDRPVEVERIVEKEVPVPYPVEVNKYIDRPYPVEKIVDRPVHIPVPVETIVEKIVERPVEVETFVETPVAVEVPVPHHVYHHLHHHHNPHPHEHLLHAHLHSHPSSHAVKHVHLDQLPVSISSQPLPYFDFSKTTETATTTLLKPVHKLLGNLWNKLQAPFFGHPHNLHHGHHQTKHVVPLYKTKYHTNDNHLYAGSYGYVADSLPGGSLYSGVAVKDSYYGPLPLAKYEPYWSSYGRTNFVAPAPVPNTIHLTPNRYNYRRHMNFLKNIRWEYGGFKPPLIPSVEIDEFGNPIHRDLDSRRR